jgi:hypothetical protein
LTSYAQEWETVVNRGPDGCYTTQIIQTVEIKNRGTALDSEKIPLYNKLLLKTLWMLEYLLILDITILMERVQEEYL